MGLVSIATIRPTKSQTMPMGCSWQAGAPQNIQTFSSSGDRNLDHVLIIELRRIISTLGVNPGFKYIYDASPNAFASSNGIVAGTYGTVYLGINLIRSELFKQWGGVAVAGICAHECGHIYQFKNGYSQSLDSTTAVLKELHADSLAGVYMGMTRAHSKERMSSFAQSLFSHGDFNFNDPGHHGTPQQRVSAMQKGYDLGAAGIGVDAAAHQASDFVRQL